MPATDSKLHLLETLPQFRPCSLRELRLIAQLAETIRVRKGAELVREGRTGYEFFIILEGSATVSQGGRTVATLGPGDHFGELALLARTVRDATVVSATAMELVVIEGRAFSGLLAESPGFRDRMFQALALRLQAGDGGVPSPRRPG